MCRSIQEGERRCPCSRPEERRRARAQKRFEQSQQQLKATIGATPYRPESEHLVAMSSRPSYYDSEEWAEFDDTLRAAAERRGVELIEADHAAGLWEGETEPSGAYVVAAGDRDAIRGWAGELAGRYNQDSVMVGFYDPDGPDTLYGFGGSDADPVEIDDAISVLRTAGISGGRVRGRHLEVASTADSPVGPAALQLLAARFGGATQDRAVVEFVEKTDSYLSHQPIKEIQALRQIYVDEHRLPRRRPIPHLTAVDDIAAADAYETMTHDPRHPKVARSYRVFRQHVRQQWDALTAAGYRFEPWTQDGQPYENSAGMLTDLRDNRHLYFFRTDVSQTTEGALPPDHPMAKTVTVSTVDGTPQRMLANDVFRAVHDAIAHSEGHQFGPYGEKRAWWTHRSSLPSEARLALWCETRGQNTWTNAGPHMRTGADGPPRLLRRDDPGFLPISQRPYAAQKCGLVDPTLV